MLDSDDLDRLPFMRFMLQSKGHLKIRSWAEWPVALVRVGASADPVLVCLKKNQPALEALLILIIDDIEYFQVNNNLINIIFWSNVQTEVFTEENLKESRGRRRDQKRSRGPV